MQQNNTSKYISKNNKKVRKGHPSPNLNWLWTDFRMWFFCLYNIYKNWWFNLYDTNAVTGFMLTIFLPAPSSRVNKAWHPMRTLVQNGAKFFFLLRKRKLSFFINYLFWNIFLVSGEIFQELCSMKICSAKKLSWSHGEHDPQFLALQLKRIFPATTRLTHEQNGIGWFLMMRLFVFSWAHFMINRKKVRESCTLPCNLVVMSKTHHL